MIGQGQEWLCSILFAQRTGQTWFAERNRRGPGQREEKPGNHRGKAYTFDKEIFSSILLTM